MFHISVMNKCTSTEQKQGINTYNGIAIIDIAQPLFRLWMYGFYYDWAQRALHYHNQLEKLHITI